ncbi:MAG: hypothetical protein H7841_12400 [Magnetospirillum sp. WYHS-4]
MSPDQYLFEAVRRNDLAAAQAAIRAGARVDTLDEWGLTAADVALDKGYFPIARYLMDMKGDSAPARPVPPPPVPAVAAAPRPSPFPPTPPVSPPPIAVVEPPPVPLPAEAAVTAPSPPVPVPVAPGVTFLDRLQGELRRVLSLETSIPPPSPESADGPPRLPPAKTEIARHDHPQPEPAPVAREGWAPKELKIATPSVPPPPPDTSTKAEEAPKREEPESAVVAESPAPEARRDGFLARLSSELRRVMKIDPSASVASIDLPEAKESWAPKAVIVPPAPVIETPVQVTAPPPVPPSPSPPSPTTGEEPAVTRQEPAPGLLSRLFSGLKESRGGDKAPPPDSEAKDAWAPRTVTTELPSEPPPQQVAALPPPTSPSPVPTPAAEEPAAKPEPGPGLLSRLFSGLKETFGGEKAKPATVPESKPAPKPKKRWLPVAEDPIATVPPEGGGTTGSGKVPSALTKLGIPDIEQYLSDEPYHPGGVAQTGRGKLPPASQVPRDPFSPGMPVAGGVPGQPPASGFDPRFERGESRRAPGNGGGLADALAPLEAGGGTEAAPPQGSGIFDRLSEFLKPPSREPNRKAAPPSGLFEEAAKDSPSEKPVQLAKAASKDREPVPPPALPAASGSIIGLPFVLAGSYSLGKALPDGIQVSTTAYGQACLSKERGTVVFCLEPLAWPTGMQVHFDVNTVLYQGFQTIVRYDAGKATAFHTLFQAGSFEAVVAHFTELYGPPTDAWMRRIAPLGSPGQDNPSVSWRSHDVTTGRVSSLEIRAFDDSRGGFPDMNHGVVLLRDSQGKPIFPRLSNLDLMVMKPAPAKPGPAISSAPAIPVQKGE